MAIQAVVAWSRWWQVAMAFWIATALTGLAMTAKGNTLDRHGLSGLAMTAKGWIATSFGSRDDGNCRIGPRATLLQLAGGNL